MKIPYVEHGDPDGIPLLLLHGYTDSWRSWEPLLRDLPGGVRAIAPTQRGHGDAERPPSGYRIEDFASDTVELMDELEIGPAVVAGHSMGAWIAERIAIDHPERVAGVVLEGAFGPARENPAVLGLADEVAQLSDPVDPAFVREFQLSTCERQLPQGMLATVVGESLKLPARVWREACAGFLEIDYSEELARIRAPVLVIWGDRDDFITRAEQDRLVERIPDARLEVYEGTGHAVHWEERERFTRDLVDFAARAARAGATA